MARWFNNVTTTDWKPVIYTSSDTAALTWGTISSDSISSEPVLRWHPLSDFTERVERNENLSPEQKKKALALLNEIKKAKVIVKDREADEKVLSKKAELLERLGLKKAAAIVKREADRFLKEVIIATYGYTKIPFEKLEEYKKKLETGLRLVEIPLAEYKGIPPTEALKKLEIAQKQGIFDEFSILTIQRVPDPILVGKINESKDLYFIAEWSEDVKLEEIIK